jgi:DNA-binding SARP family transcriptional activator
LFQLKLLGTPSLKDGNGVTPPSLGWGKPLALLALLSVTGEARRDEIVDLLWRDVDEDKARNAFRQALHRLRSALGETIIPMDREVLRLVPGTDLSIDLRAFESSVVSGRIDEALELYRGDFLQSAILDEPAFDQWADQERLRLRARYRSALEQGVASAQSSGDWTRAIELSRRLIEIAPLDENAARTAALACLSAGRRTEARDVIVQFSVRLQSELGLPLPPELQAMLTRLDRMGDAPPAGPGAATAPHLQLRFGGREAELSRLLSLWRGTGDDAGSIALIEGDEGIGKTRLVGELAIHARSLGRTTVLTGCEYPGTTNVPFASIAEALRPLVRAPGVAGASRHLLAEAARLLPELRDTFDLPPVAAIEDEASRVRFFEGIAALVDATAYEHPVLIVLENLQYAAPSTLDLLSYLVARLAGSSVMVVLTARPDAGVASPVARCRALLAERPAGTERALHLSLSPLDAVGVNAALADSARALPEQVRSRIVDRSAGVPARIAELLRRALEGDSLAQPPVPVRVAIEDRLRALSSTHRRTFLVLSLLGRPCNVGSLASMAHLTEAAALETLQVLESSQLVVRDADAFEAESLAAEVALETAGDASRAFLAGWIAEALATDPRVQPAEVARFFAVAGRAKETYDASRRAAFAAMRIGAWAEAVQHLHVARSAASVSELSEIEGLLSGLGAGKPRLAPSPAPDTPAGNAQSDGQQVSAGAQVDSWRERWFPNWRILFGAALGTLAISAIVMARAPARTSRASTDTLVVAEGEDTRTVRMVTGDLVGGFMVSAPVDRGYPGINPSDSLSRLYARFVGPRGRVFGMSPDDRWLLVGIPHAPADDDPDVDLIAVRVDDGARVALDTMTRRSITEASWSPDGSRIAWVARVGDERQQEILIAFADGSAVENVTRHPADDYHLAWSGDGELLGFTSTRDDNAELYAYSVHERRLWRLTRDPAQDDWARFAPSGRLVSFESTRGGESGVYVMPALGGEPVRIGPDLSIAALDWRRGPRSYLDRIRLDAVSTASVDTVAIRVTGLDQNGNVMKMELADADIRVAGGERAVLAAAADVAGRLLVGRGTGLVKVVASVGGWRVDTTIVRLGAAPVVLADGTPSADEWVSLGSPRPIRTGAGVLLNGDADGESGVISRDVVPVVPGLELATEFAGMDSVTLDRASISVAMVAPEQAGVLDSVAPQFLRYVSAAWDGDARRMIFVVGREVHSELAALATTEGVLRIRLRVEPDSTVSFHLGGALRWRSTVRVIDGRGVKLAQAWIGGRSTGTLRMARARLALARVSSP